MAKKKRTASKKTAKKKTSKKRTSKKTAKKRSSHASARKKTSRAAEVDFDLFRADRLVIDGNAETADDRATTRAAALTAWSDEDIGELFRHESGVAWGWAMRRYAG